MLNAITFEKVEEIIRIVERADAAAPDDRPDDPHRGGALGSEGVSRPAPPTEPQPAPDWAHALERYLADLPDAALSEVLALYRFGRGDAASIREAGREATGSAEPHGQRVAFLASRGDLAPSLRRALERL